VCKEIWLVTFIFASMRRLWVYTKVKPGQHLLLDLSRRYNFNCISQLILEYIVLSCHRLPIGVRICSNCTPKSTVCIMNRNMYSIIGKIWDKCYTDFFAYTLPRRWQCELLHFGNIPKENTFHISSPKRPSPKRRRRTVLFRQVRPLLRQRHNAALGLVYY